MLTEGQDDEFKTMHSSQLGKQSLKHWKIVIQKTVLVHVSLFQYKILFNTHHTYTHWSVQSCVNFSQNGSIVSVLNVNYSTVW